MVLTEAIPGGAASIPANQAGLDASLVGSVAMNDFHVAACKARN